MAYRWRSLPSRDRDINWCSCSPPWRQKHGPCLLLRSPDAQLRDSRWLAVPSQESLKASLSSTSSAGVLGVGDADVTGVGGVVCPSTNLTSTLDGAPNRSPWRVSTVFTSATSSPRSWFSSSIAMKSAIARALALGKDLTLPRTPRKPALVCPRRCLMGRACPAVLAHLGERPTGLVCGRGVTSLRCSAALEKLPEERGLVAFHRHHAHRVVPKSGSLVGAG